MLSDRTTQPCPRADCHSTADRSGSAPYHYSGCSEDSARISSNPNQVLPNVASPRSRLVSRTDRRQAIDSARSISFDLLNLTRRHKPWRWRVDSGRGVVMSGSDIGCTEQLRYETQLLINYRSVPGNGLRFSRQRDAHISGHLHAVPSGALRWNRLPGTAYRLLE